LAHNCGVNVYLLAWRAWLALWALRALAVVAWTLFAALATFFLVAAWTTLGLAARRAWLHPSANACFTTSTTE
jgi:hypothetical protein